MSLRYTDSTDESEIYLWTYLRSLRYTDSTEESGDGTDSLAESKTGL
jgi:hypothetical protein